ncbi:NADH-ubiquinone oxidoreductase-F iron-sulfur binding region domain-containing protein [Streptomyces sp. BK205]|uniref:NADH-ubiquinone oxidoreductase-F iron-sulfur binding region domain-containing protein n=1 Tax=Streptomyces sp. BK205 TaxID=2512164 RepID=UPI001FB39174|nr:NADH-ubiquinone oxidoreductase-F iron-sulfur binding region domain-containing protein [Streptomyces sp. BK205]
MAERGGRTVVVVNAMESEPASRKALAAGRADRDLLSRLHRRTALLPDRGACRHPDGAARLAASALRVFADDVDQHLTHGTCAAAHRPTLISVPPAEPPERWR